MPLRAVLTPFALAGAMVALSACGSDSKEESEKPSGAATALTELGKTRDGLEQALATYKNGDKATAGDQVSEAYLEHFEHVEGALEAKDHELNEQLEDGIREELRDKIKHAPANAVEAQFTEIYANLDKAEALLK